MDEFKGLFDLSVLDEATENETVELKLNESTDTVEVMTESRAWKEKLLDLKKKCDTLDDKIGKINILAKEAPTDAAKKKLKDKYNKLVAERDEIAKTAEEISNRSVSYNSFRNNTYDGLKELLGKGSKPTSGIRAYTAKQEDRKPGFYSKMQAAMAESFEKFIDSDEFDKWLESAEFEDECPSMNPEVHFDADNSGNKTIPVPGGDKEEPKANVKDQEIPVPGGDKEKPDAKPADGETAIPGGTKVVLDDKTYNAALDNLQKSFKEAADLIEAIKNAERVSESVEDMYESAMDNAFTDFSYGPLFERVKREDKEGVKEIVSKIKDDVKDKVKEAGYKFYNPVRAFRRLFNEKENEAYAALWQTRLFQVVGAVCAEPEAREEIEKMLNNKYKEELGGYKIFVLRMTPSFINIFRTAFGLNNRMVPYLIFIDKTIPAELKVD